MSEAGHEAEPDFLARMVDKALGTEGGIAPRMRSLFEPALEAPLAASPTWLNESTRAAEPMPEDAHGHPSWPSPVAEPGRPPPHDDSPPGRAEQAPVAAAAPRKAGAPLASDAAPAAKLQPPAVPAVAAKPVPPVIVPMPDRFEPSAIPLPIPAPAATAAAPRRGEAGASPPPPRLGPVPQAALPPMREDQAATSEEHGSSLSADEPAPTRLVPTPAVERFLVAVPSVRRRAQRDERGRQQPDAPAAAVVNVTIGRVEVRAMPAPAAQPPRAARGPQPLSLDDYLKQRRGER